MAGMRIAGFAAGFAACAGALGAPPRPDHVVIVIEENHSFAQVIGSADAPYINGLAQNGALLTGMYAITHPSQPNYLEFFSGSTQGLTDDSQPAGTPFSTPNLGAALMAAGVNFVGYSEDLPGPGSLVFTSGAYARKHVPWTNWQAAAPGMNQFGPGTNLPFTSFPSDPGQLPKVAFVVPNLNNDMHDGTIAQADYWLQLHIGAYAQWAQLNNSLLIVTWDEDESANGNHIPTILYGPMVRPGTYSSVWTLHNLHRTIADMFGAAPSGAATGVQAITGIWAGDGLQRSVRFQQGAAGYLGAHDTYVEQANAATGHGADARLVADGSPLSQGLVRFDGVFGSGAGAVPLGAGVLSAKLMILTGSLTSDNSGSTMNLHRMLTAWTDAATWNGLTGGVSANGVECAAYSDFAVTPAPLGTREVFDVTGTVRAWAGSTDPNAANLGWAILPGGTDGWRFNSSEAPAVGDRPLLEVTYACVADFNASGGVTVQDLFDFLAAWFASAPAADVNHSGMVSVQDIFDFLAAWFGGC